MNSLEILYKSEQVVVVHKPYDININSNSKEETTVESLLLEKGIRCTDEGKSLTHSYYWIHRLDYATSGVLCIALTKEAAKRASLAFEQRLVRKYYVALVRGHVTLEDIAQTHSDVQLVTEGIPHLDIHAGLVRDNTTDFPFLFTTQAASYSTSTATESSDVKDAVKVFTATTSVYVLERGSYDGEEGSKLLLVPLTGRSHQLRVHCNFIGHTIIGDYTYSRRQDTAPHRMMLHAYSIHIPTIDLHINSKEDPYIHDTKWLPVAKYRQLDHLLDTLNCTNT